MLYLNNYNDGKVKTFLDSSQNVLTVRRCVISSYIYSRAILLLKIGSLRLRVATSTAQFFIAMKRTRGYIMTLEGYVAKDFNSDAKQKTCHIPHIMSTPFHKRKIIQEHSDKLKFNQ